MWKTKEPDFEIIFDKCWMLSHGFVPADGDTAQKILGQEEALRVIYNNYVPTICGGACNFFRMLPDCCDLPTKDNELNNCKIADFSKYLKESI